MTARVRGLQTAALAACCSALQCQHSSGPARLEAPTKSSEAPPSPSPLRATELPELDEGLFEAIERRDLAAVRKLVDEDAVLEARNKEGLTPLLAACRARDGAAAVKLLVAAGARVDATDKLGRTALHFACLGGNTVSARVLIRAGASISQKCNRRGATPAHYAAAFARVDVLRMLLAADAALVDARDNLGRVPLHWCALSAHREWAEGRCIDVGELLLRNGAKPTARDKTGSTPAHVAARLGATAFLDFLVDKADLDLLDQRDNRGITPLDIAAARYDLTRFKSNLLWRFPLWTGLPDFRFGIALPRSLDAFDPAHSPASKPPRNSGPTSGPPPDGSSGGRH